jgi:hypothetical protein
MNIEFEGQLRINVKTFTVVSNQDLKTLYTVEMIPTELGDPTLHVVASEVGIVSWEPKEFTNVVESRTIFSDKLMKSFIRRGLWIVIDVINHY